MHKCALRRLRRHRPKCCLCKLPLMMGAIGKPVTCNHSFRFGCLELWTENNANNGGCKCPDANCDKYYQCIRVMTMRDGADSVYYPIERDYHCPVCNELVKDDFASPNTCDHNFCYTCLYNRIVEESVCPIDRKPFNGVEIFSCVGALPSKAVS